MSLQKIDVKNLDHLGLVAGMIDTLGIVETIDEAMPRQESASKISFGEAVKAMLLNGLGYTTKPLYLTPLFFKDKPLERLFGHKIAPEWFHDDTLGRTLDALFEYGVSDLYETIAATVLSRL